jgi:RND family efflux transporter MFP subunit
MKKLVVALVIMVVLGGVAGLSLLGWAIYSRVKARQAAGGSANGARGPGGRRGGGVVAVETAAVQKATIRSVGRFTGSLAPRSRFVVAPKVAGRLEKLTVDIGDVVKPGQEIARLDDDEYDQQLQQAKADLAVANAQVAECRSSLDLAEGELKRVKSLHEKKMASDAELEASQAQNAAAVAKHAVALAQVKRSEAALKAAEVRLSYTRIVASWAASEGPRVVGERFVDEGTMLRANDPIVSILDNKTLTAQIDVIERDYPKVHVGQTAAITTDGCPGREFTGKIVRIAPLVKETSRQAQAQIEIPNLEGLLKPGMFVRAELEFQRHENATVVPLSALAKREAGQGVFLVDTANSKVRFVPVKIGLTEGEKVEVLQPADLEGEVVTLGHHLLQDGAAVLLPDARPEGLPADKASKGQSKPAGAKAGPGDRTGPGERR